MTRRKNLIGVILLTTLVGMCFDGASCYPPSYSWRDPGQPVPMTTTPKMIRDVFVLNKQVKTLPIKNQRPQPVPNPGSDLFEPVRVWKPHPAVKQFDDPKTKLSKTHQKKTNAAFKKIMPKPGVWMPKPARRLNDDPKKAAKKPRKLRSGNGGQRLWKTQRRQNDDETGDDPEEGADDVGVEADLAGGKSKKSMPMTIIRGFDVIAMDMPIGGKDCNQPPETPDEGPSDDGDQEEAGDESTGDEGPEETEQETETDSCTTTPACTTTEEVKVQDSCLSGEGDSNWGDWSSCSKSCGVGVQSRSRVDPSGSSEQDMEFRPCHLADCPDLGPEPPVVGLDLQESGDANVLPVSTM